MKEYSYGIAPYKIIDNNIYALVAQAHKNGLYGFVKGKIENETIPACAVREFFEETNVKLDINYLEKYFYQTYTRKNIGIFLYNHLNIDFSDMDIYATRQELHSIQYLKLNYELYLQFQYNQRKIFNDICLYFKTYSVMNI